MRRSVRDHRRRLRPLVWAAAAAALLLPFSAPAQLPWLRLLLGLVGWLALQKALDLWTRAPRDPRTQASLRALLLWAVIPPPTRWPTGPTEAADNRHAGLRRLGRGLSKACALGALLLLSHTFPSLHGMWPLRSLWGLWVGYFVFSGGIDLYCSLPMLGGLQVDEVFNAPFLARSPAEFWSRRWNRWVQSALGRYVFRPLRRRPWLALAVTFLVSGVAHEYLTIAALGVFTGEMLAFFGLQGLAVLAQRPLGRGLARLGLQLPVGAQISAHIAWLVVTGPLFLEPVLRIVPLDTW